MSAGDIPKPNKEAFEKAFKEVSVLVNDFKKQADYYLSSKYSEAHVRSDYINKFLKAFGWDVDHDIQKNPHEQEVKVEKDVEIKGRNKRADYAFYIAPNFRDEAFFIEAKKPSRDLYNATDYFQVARYSWSRNVPIAVLTDFEEFHVIDCRNKPDINTILDRQLVRFHYSEYENDEKFAFIYYLFSRDAVASDSIDKYAKSLPVRRGKAVQKGLFKGGFKPVDEAFLDQLDEYRLTLAKAFKKANPDLGGPELTEATQRTLDRIVFLRFLEDKMIEPEEYVTNFGDSGTVWADFLSACKKLSVKYNGLIFNDHPIDRKDFKAPEDAEFGAVCEDISHLNSPYDFNAIPIEIFGSIYERFLGKIVHATSKQVRVEEKIEVRKAGGVYYTPGYIVRTIVNETVGKIVDGKSPNEIAGMRFADISCGSGSFLLGVYGYLLDYHVRWYQAHPPTTKKEKAEAYEHEGSYVLSLDKKRDILLNNIFGIDLDAQAVEVTSVSLYLKLLEDETLESLRQLQLLTHQAVLPPLDKNIKYGNSLVESDYLGTELIKNDSELLSVRPLDLAHTFPEIIKEGGFNAIVGNPPYIRIQTMAETNPKVVEYYSNKYVAGKKGNYDIYVLFVERGLSLLRNSGRLGYILPHKFMNAQYGEGLRNILSSGRYVSKIIHFGHQQIFKDASTYTCLLFLDKNSSASAEVVKVDDLDDWKKSGNGIKGEIGSSDLTSKEWNIVVGKSAGLFKKMSAFPVHLEDVTTRIFQGVKTSADKIYILEERERTSKKVKAFSPQLATEVWLEPDLIHPLIKGGDSRRYHLSKSDLLLLFPYTKNKSGEMGLTPSSEIKDKYPLTWDYLMKNKKYLEDREDGKMKHSEWYAYIYPKALEVIHLPKIFTPDIAPTSAFSLDKDGNHYFTGGVAGGYGLLVKDSNDRNAILGILNSKLLEWFNKQVASQMRGGWFSYESRFISRWPIIEKAGKETIYELLDVKVQKIIEMNNGFHSAKTESDKTTFKGQIEVLEKEIDNAVFGLYEITSDEKNIVLDFLK